MDVWKYRVIFCDECTHTAGVKYYDELVYPHTYLKYIVPGSTIGSVIIVRFTDLEIQWLKSQRDLLF